jgi:ceramide glucosyltransferase
MIGFLVVIYTAYTLATLVVKNRCPRGLIENCRYPRVSILKPVKNLDDGFAENIESFFNINYPEYEIIAAVDRRGDPAEQVIRRISKKYPDVSCRVIETGHCSRYNPKVHKLTHMEKIATGDLLWITDSNIRISPDVLVQLVNEYLLNGTKLVFSPIRATAGRSWGSIIENAYINLFLSGNVILAWKWFRQHLIVGKSILFERQTLDHLGGFSYFREYLAEDFMMGEIYRSCNFPLATNYVWVTTVNSNTTFSGFLKRMIRWGKLRYRLKPHFYILEIFLNPVPVISGTLAVFPLNTALLVISAVLGFKVFLELCNYRFVNHGPGSKLSTLLLLPLLLLLKDLLLFYAYFAPFFSDTVEWRGGKITIGRDTLIHSGREPLQLEGA